MRNRRDEGEGPTEVGVQSVHAASPSHVARITYHAISLLMDYSWILLSEVSTGIDLVFSVVDQPDNAVAKISDLIFLGQIYLTPVID